ncbi:MAG: glycosyltransferase family 9 protein [Burkholderiaceae bacterium]|jgi:lipopolysaccharide heptosyltransferase II|nr:glycosyltransferase family 9 protein [Burkholderiaceae bacterium]
MNEAWAKAERVLCVRLDNMGDVLMTTPAIRAIRAAKPSRRITLLGSLSGVRVAAHVTEIDAAIGYEAPWVKNARTEESGTDVDRALVETLAAHRFDAAVIFTAYSQSPIAPALVCRMAGIPLRLAHCRENPYLLLSDWLPETEPAQRIRHEVDRQLDLVAGFAPRPSDLRLSFSVADLDRAALETKLREAGVDPEAARVVVHPGASAPSRRWPAAHFAQTLRELAQCQNREIVLTGDAGETTLVSAIAAQAGNPACVHDLSGRLSLGELGALLERADLLIANNTGPVHVAAALGTPVVDLYALTNPQHAPWRVPARVLNRDVPCRNCYKSVCPNGTQACLAGVEPREAVQAALALLSARRSLRALEERFTDQEN